ncbi:MAG: hypothetical protein LBO09_05920 [Candidatus Peribacteria bacterium]|jgi:hypothetical protein|nr:hypothetical protein [Candidatus Peribacteria bacterium]
MEYEKKLQERPNELQQINTRVDLENTLTVNTLIEWNNQPITEVFANFIAYEDFRKHIRNELKNKRKIDVLIDISELSNDKIISIGHQSKALLESMTEKGNNWLEDEKRHLLEITLQGKDEQKADIANDLAS